MTIEPTTDTVVQLDGYEPAVIDRGAITSNGYEAIRVLSRLWSDVRTAPAADLDAKRGEIADRLVEAIEHLRTIHIAVWAPTSVPPPADAAEREAAVREAMKRCAPIDPAALEAGRKDDAARDAIAARHGPIPPATLEAAREVIAKQHPAASPYVPLHERQRMQERILRGAK